MTKLLLLSLPIMTFLLPMRAARNPNPVRGLRRSVMGMAAWIAIYMVILNVISL